MKATIILVLGLICGAFPTTSFAQVPMNAHKVAWGKGWECDRGFYEVRGACSKIVVPANARVDYTGHAWECDRGYRRSVNQCAKVEVPEHASLDYTGHGWECDRGYRRSGAQCAAVAVPQNASLDYTGHSWECDRGYQRGGGRCVAVPVPQNASLDYTGHSWICNDGYIRRQQECVALFVATVNEIRQALIAASLGTYPGNCPCPYNVDRAGRSCGGRSAYSRAGGRSPLCYEADISAEQVRVTREKYRPRGQ